MLPRRVMSEGVRGRCAVLRTAHCTPREMNRGRGGERGGVRRKRAAYGERRIMSGRVGRVAESPESQVAQNVESRRVALGESL